MARFVRTIAFLVFLIVVSFPASRLETAINHGSPFRFTGDGKINLIDTHTFERLVIVYRDKDGFYDDLTLRAVNHTLRCHGKSEKYPISLKLIELIDHLQDNFGVEEVQVISGYRSPEYNAALTRRSGRVAHNSLHMRGLAMDIRMPGVDKHKLGQYARSLRTGGVGVYGGSGFVHVDVGPVRSW
ncbi:MAG: YcbK family protein [Deltaproteobacteria bacterium]|jgi:uncharacterized protein YcbK (DUF882 family)|nr:YcbK family protein [Deltaproteobacteria bacterium]